MPESAFDATVAQFLCLGLQPRIAHDLAGLLYPFEGLVFEDEEQLAAYTNFVLNSYATEFISEGDYINPHDAIAARWKRGAFTRVGLYLDGSNLARSLSYIVEHRRIRQGTLERFISINTRNYRSPRIDGRYPAYYLAWCLAQAVDFPSSRIDHVVYVMCADDPHVHEHLRLLHAKYGFDVLVPEKVGTGSGSSRREDTLLKTRILHDLENDSFDAAIIGTGDGRRTDGLSFPDVATLIKCKGKEVKFVGFDISTHRSIKEHFGFFDLQSLLCLPREGGPESLSLDFS